MIHDKSTTNRTSGVWL